MLRSVRNRGKHHTPHATRLVWGGAHHSLRHIPASSHCLGHTVSDTRSRTHGLGPTVPDAWSRTHGLGRTASDSRSRTHGLGLAVTDNGLRLLCSFSVVVELCSTTTTTNESWCGCSGTGAAPRTVQDQHTILCLLEKGYSLGHAVSDSQPRNLGVVATGRGLPPGPCRTNTRFFVCGLGHAVTGGGASLCSAFHGSGAVPRYSYMVAEPGSANYRVQDSGSTVEPAFPSAGWEARGHHHTLEHRNVGTRTPVTAHMAW